MAPRPNSYSDDKISSSSIGDQKAQNEEKDLEEVPDGSDHQMAESTPPDGGF